MNETNKTQNDNTSTNNSAQIQLRTNTSDSPVLIERQLGLSLEGLNEEQKNALRYRAAESCIDLKVEAIKAQNQLVISSAEMNQTIQKANELSEGNQDFSIRSDHKTATGNTSIRVSNYKNVSWGIILAIIGVISIVLLAKGC